ncbi:hypothetical protein [Kiloniella antarctica]|uniref:O-GlcNAc transferase C-terminal domain-containing protein n=1 Tax=Kiloniella antarctica TaxID=1550907 RepID=A0ABW5BR18_9PROT
MADQLLTLYEKHKNRWNISDYNTKKWRSERLEIAKRWGLISISEINLEINGHAVSSQQLPCYWYRFKSYLLTTIFLPTKEEKRLLNDIIQRYHKSADHEEKTKLLLILGLFYYPHHLFSNNKIKLVTDFENITYQALQPYIVFLLNYPQMLFANDEANQLQDYYEWILAHIKKFLETTSDKQKRNHILKWCTTIFIGVNVTDRNLKNLYKLRGEIIELYIQSRHPQLPTLIHEFRTTKRNKTKTSIGLIITRIQPTPETSIWLSHFRALDPKKYEKFLFKIPTSPQSDKKFEQHFCSYFDHIIPLECDNFYPLEHEDNRNLATKNCVAQIRSYNLDLLSLSSVPSNYFLNFENTLAPYRLAKKQFLTTATSPQTSGLSHIDYMISSPSMEPPKPEEQFTETLIIEPGSNHCFDYSGRRQNVTIEITRKSLNIPQNHTVLINGSSMGKLSREVITLWLEVLKKSSDTTLILFPYNPLWTDRYSHRLFEEYLFMLCSTLKVDPKRIYILPPRKHYYEINAILKMGDIYVDSFPFSGATSILDAFIAGLPTVIKSGRTQRTMQAAAMNKAIHLDERVSYTDEQYKEHLLELIAMPSLRQNIKARTKEALNNSAPFLDVLAFNKRHERIIEKLISWENNG